MINQHVLSKKAVKAWGVPAQLGMVMEECAELIVAVNKLNRNSSSKEEVNRKIGKVIEEIADVEIMLEQLKFICGPQGMKQRIDEVKEIKLLRLKSLLEVTNGAS